jgi:hypothetical protein
MHRPNGMTDAANTTVVNGLDYGPANELKAITYFGSSEARQYNPMLQLTHLTICCDGRGPQCGEHRPHFLGDGKQREDHNQNDS